MSIGKRLSEQRRAAGYSKQEMLGDKLGVSFTTISRWEQDQNPIPSDKLVMMGEIGLDVTYILTGKRAATVAAFEDTKLLENKEIIGVQKHEVTTSPDFALTSSRDKHLPLAEGVAIYAVPDDLVTAPRGKAAPKMDGYVFVPLYDIEASSGDGSLLANEYIVEYIPFALSDLHANYLNPQDLGAARNKGDSMVPTLSPRGRFVFDESKRRVDGDVFFFRYHDEFYIKRLSREGSSIRVISDNKAYPAWVISDPENCQIIGKKVWSEQW